MERQQKEDSKQIEMEAKEKIVSEQSKKVGSNNMIDQSENRGIQHGATWIRKTLNDVWAFCLQHKIIAAVTCVGVLLGGIGTLIFLKGYCKSIVIKVLSG